MPNHSMQHLGSQRTNRWTCRVIAVLAGLAACAFCQLAIAQELLPGEFQNIELGRELIEPVRVPTVTELRRLVAKPQVEPVLLFRLHGDRETGDEGHAVPVWSPDGRKLAFQRVNTDANLSKLLIFRSLADPQPLVLTKDRHAYDYMFRWSVHGDRSFAFVRIDSTTNRTQLCFSSDGDNVEALDDQQGVHAFPALFKRTDGVWRLCYDRDGDLVHRAWNRDGDLEPPTAIGRGSAPRWHSDGRRLVMLRERARPGRLAAADVVIRDLQTGGDLLFQTPSAGTIRAPVWSPDGIRIAFFFRDVGNDKPWRIDYGNADDRAETHTAAHDVIVNPDFTSEGPSWSPDGRQVWYFTQAKRDRAYYPMVAYNITDSSRTVVDYHRRLTTPADLAVNPVTPTPEIAFVATHDGSGRDLFIALLNHF